jgi:ferredoxin-NADP reductase
MDASHRGGPLGFVTVVDDRTLIIPDYKGNNHFNTIGNLVVDPRAGLLFVDFETGALLQLTGEAEIDWDSPAVADYPGARRLIRFTIEEANLLEGALPLRWHVADDSVYKLRLVEKIAESADVTSFYFEHAGGRRLADFSAGQHLPIEIHCSDRKERLRRTYSLSSGPADAGYRISVKRESKGRVSRQLHDSLEPGDTVTASAPSGDFILDHGARPVVLVSAGIGVTPMVSMLHELSTTPGARPVYFVHGARDGAHHALAEEVTSMVEAEDNFYSHISYSRPRAEDRRGHDFDTIGRVDGALLASILPNLEAEFYLCGPLAFMASVQTQLEGLGVPPAQIHSESFGPT